MHVLCSLLLAGTAALSGTACNRHDRDSEMRTSRASAYAVDTTLHAGDIRIVDMNGGADLALIGDTISGGLSPATIARVKRETDSSTVAGGGFAASIEKIVKGTVATVLATRIAVPVHQVTDIAYEDGVLRISTTDSDKPLFHDTKINDRRVMESFHPDDARRFVAAVKARQRQRGNW